MRFHPHYDLLLSWEGEVFRNGKKMPTVPNPKGYLRVSFRVDGKVTTRFVHRLVAETFIELPPGNEDWQVNHMDSDKTNNCVENLEWVTPSQNERHKRGLRYRV